MFRRFLESTRAMVTPVSVTSSYAETGRLSVQEFVNSGDYLVNNWPLWSWLGTTSKQGFAYLPDNKQYIRASHVTSNERVSDVYNSALHDSEENDDEYGTGIVIVSESPKKPSYMKQRDIEIFESCENEEVVFNDYGYINEETESPEFRASCYTLPPETLGIRKYTIDITYDTYYATPRFWIFGMDIYNSPLTHMEIMEDISADHKHRTVTVEHHPFLGYQCISVHPCMHSNLMFQFGPAKGLPDPTTSILNLLPLLTTIMPTTDFVGLGC